MKKTKYYKSDIRIITVVYLFIISFIPVLAFTLTPGCSEEIVEKEAILSEAVADSTLNKIIVQELLKSNIVESDTGSGVHYEHNYKVETSTPVIYANQLRWVKQVDEIKDKDVLKSKVYTVANRVIQYEDGRVISDVTDEPPQIAVDVSGADLEINQLAPLAAKNLIENNKTMHLQSFQKRYSAYDMDTLEQYKITIHNLETKRMKKAVPKLVAAKPNCLGIPACQLDIFKLSFVQVLWEDGKIIDRANTEIYFTHQIPFLFSHSDPTMLFPALKHCQGYFARTEDRDYFVKDCKILRDFNL